MRLVAVKENKTKGLYDEANIVCNVTWYLYGRNC